MLLALAGAWKAVRDEGRRSVTGMGTANRTRSDEERSASRGRLLRRRRQGRVAAGPQTIDPRLFTWHGGVPRSGVGGSEHHPGGSVRQDTAAAARASRAAPNLKASRGDGKATADKQVTRQPP